MLIIGIPAYSQHCLSGKIQNEQGEALAGATLILMAGDSLVGGVASDQKGNFKLCEIPGGNYVYTISMLGYKSKEGEISLQANRNLGTVALSEEAQKVDEVVVSADRRNIVRQGAGTTTFLLSENASKAQNAFAALREIPKLSVNETEQTIRLTNGTTPLILINGINRPGYINSLNPEDIASVEVIENPSARYRGKQSVHSVLNIKLKPKREASYVNGYISSKHHVAGVYGISSGSLEVGNSKASLFLNAQHFYFHNDDGDTYYERTMENIRQVTDGERRYKSHQVWVNLGGDWIVNEKNYLAANATLITNPSKIYNDQAGETTDLATWLSSPLAVSQYINNKYLTNDYSLFYRHSFSEDSHLEATGSFGLYTSGAKGTRTESSDTDEYTSFNDLDNNQKQGTLELNYDVVAAGKLALDFGANTYFTRTKIDERTTGYEPFIYKNWTEYLYASLRNRQNQRLSYMFSLGLDMVFTNADGEKNHYVNFVPSASLSYSLSGKSSLSADYTRRRTSPSASQLNPRNTSIDSALVRVGNPYLRPFVDNIVTLRYTWNSQKGIYIEPYITYDYINKQIGEVGFMDRNVYTYTYDNIDDMQQIVAGVTTNFNFSKFGNISLTAYYQKDIIDDLPFSGNSFHIYSNMNFWYKKVSLSLFMYYNSATYTPISKSYMTPESELTFNWSLPKNWNLQLGLRYFMAKDNHTVIETIDKGYTSYNWQKMSDRFLMPMIGISYTFRNKKPYKYRQKHIPQGGTNEVSGIKIAE